MVSKREARDDWNISLHQQIECVQRQIRFMKIVFPQWVSQKKKTPADARLEIEAMQAVLQTLEKLMAKSP